MPQQAIRCPSGHYYDGAKHSGCPYCGVDLAAAPPESGKTRQLGPVDSAASHSPPTPTPARPHASSPGATQAIFERKLGIDPVVGWLVCVAGPDRGKDFRIKMEKNFIGRSPAMDICLSDAAVSREKHAAVVFDPKKRTFWLLPGDSQGLVYVNDELVHSPSTLKQHDKIELGETKLLFVPYPLEEFPWE